MILFVLRLLETLKREGWYRCFSIFNQTVVAFFLAESGCNFLIPTRSFGYEESLRMTLIVNGRVYHIFFTRSRSPKNMNVEAFPIYIIYPVKLFCILVYVFCLHVLFYHVWKKCASHLLHFFPPSNILEPCGYHDFFCKNLQLESGGMTFWDVAKGGFWEAQAAKSKRYPQWNGALTD